MVAGIAGAISSSHMRQRHGSGERVVSGGDRDGQQLRCADLTGNRLAAGLQADDVDPDRLDGPLPALLEGAARATAGLG
jgi:hypothetical protein